MAVGKKKKGYVEGSNMDMGMELVYMEIEDFDLNGWGCKHCVRIVGKWTLTNNLLLRVLGRRSEWS